MSSIPLVAVELSGRGDGERIDGTLPVGRMWWKWRAGAKTKSPARAWMGSGCS
jgi:hypothetical protein